MCQMLRAEPALGGWDVSPTSPASGSAHLFRSALPAQHTDTRVHTFTHTLRGTQQHTKAEEEGGFKLSLHHQGVLLPSSWRRRRAGLPAGARRAWPLAACHHLGQRPCGHWSNVLHPEGRHHSEGVALRLLSLWASHCPLTGVV